MAKITWQLQLSNVINCEQNRKCEIMLPVEQNEQVKYFQKKIALKQKQIV